MDKSSAFNNRGFALNFLAEIEETERTIENLKKEVLDAIVSDSVSEQMTSVLVEFAQARNWIGNKAELDFLDRLDGMIFGLHEDINSDAPAIPLTLGLTIHDQRGHFAYFHRTEQE